MAKLLRFMFFAGVVCLIAAPLAAQPARPDLRVNKMYLAKWTPPPVTEYQPLNGAVLSGQKVFLVCEVINGGTAKIVGNYFVSFRIDGAEVGSQLIENAPDPGLLRKPGTAWTAGALGTHTFTCVLDPFPSRQAESNEQNNEQSLSFNVRIKLVPIPVKR